MNENEMHEIYEMAIDDLNEYASIILGFNKDRKYLHNYCNMSEKARNGLVNIMLTDPDIFGIPRQLEMRVENDHIHLAVFHSEEDT